MLGATVWSDVNVLYGLFLYPLFGCNGCKNINIKMEICVIYKKKSPVVKLRMQGSDSINRASEQRQGNIQTVPGQQVHIRCREVYTNQKKISQDIRKNVQSPSTSDECFTRSKASPFNYNDQCLFCGEPAKVDDKKCYIYTLQTQYTISNVVWISGLGKIYLNKLAMILILP